MLKSPLEIIQSRSFVAPLIIILISIAVYSNTFGGGFVWDDRGLILSNKSIQSIRNIPLFFGADSWKMTGQPSGPYYRPVINVLWTLEFLLWGKNPVGYHFTNIFLHALLSLLIYSMCRKISGSDTVSFLSALIFAVHPVHVEDVAWITGVGYIVCTILIVLSFLFYMKFSDDRSAASMAISVVLFVFAVFSIEYALMLPFVIIAYEFLVKGGKIRLRSILPFVLIPAIYIVLRAFIVSARNASDISVYSRVLTSFVLIVKYLGAFFFPLKLKILYDIKPVSALIGKGLIFSISILAGVAVFMIYLYRKDRKALFYLLWFFLFLAPVLNIIVVIKPQMMSLRYLYIPSIGLAMFSVVYIEKLLPKIKIATVVVVVALLSVVTFIQNRYWLNEISLYGKMVSDAPASALARNNLGVAYLEAGMPFKALTEFEEAVRLDPTYGFAFFNLGNTYQTLNMLDKAIFYLRSSIAINPSDSRAHNSLGVTYKKMGRYQESLNEFDRALAANPRNYEAHYNMANLLYSAGQERDAMQHYIQFLELAPEEYNAVKLRIKKMLAAKGVLRK